MPTDISGPLPQIDLGQGYFVVVDTGNAAAIVTRLAVSGTYYPPADAPEADEGALWLDVPNNLFAGA